MTEGLTSESHYSFVGSFGRTEIAVLLRVVVVVVVARLV